MMRTLTVAALAGWLVVSFASPAHADLTAFLGSTTTPAARRASGVSFGATLIIVGVEGEYSSTIENDTSGAPALKTVMGNLIVGLPTGAVQPYFTVGTGAFHETYLGTSVTGLGTNVGGGVKIRLAGPLRVRLDYRHFTLNGQPRYANVSRVYAGLNLAF
jgi:hypothetical protein